MDQERTWREMNHLYKEIDGIYYELVKSLGLSDSAFLILYALLDLGGGCLQRDISNQYSLRPQTVNSSIKKLVAQGYLQLTPGRGRDIHLFLTDAGHQLAAKTVLPAMEMERRAYEGLEPQEREQLVRLCQKYNRLLLAQVNSPRPAEED